MANSTALALLRTNVGFPSADAVPDGVTELLKNDLDTAAAELVDMGIVLDESRAADINLQVMYAAWLYNKRKTGEGMGDLEDWLVKHVEDWKGDTNERTEKQNGE